LRLIVSRAALRLRKASPIASKSCGSVPICRYNVVSRSCPTSAAQTL
jgi:hypothetical protein